jgi:hypothetical protein
VIIVTFKQPFSPHFGTNQVVAPAAASAAASISRDDKQVRVVNTGANIGYFRTYDSTAGAQSATTADCPVPAGLSTTITKGTNHDAIAYISAAGTTFQVMTGEGF